MILVALCADSVDAPALRPSLLAEHGAYLRSLDSLRFSAPLARRDDALVTGEGIESSVIILEGDDWDDIVATLLADPYAAGGVWARIDLYALNGSPHRPSGGHMVDLTRTTRWYMCLDSAGDGGTRAMSLDRRGEWHSGGRAASSLDILTTPGTAGWREMRIFDADDLSTASVLPDGSDRAGLSLTFAIPVAAGSWTRRE